MMEMESVMTEKPENMEAICRLCLSQRTDSLKSIFDPTLSPNRLSLKIHQLIQVQVVRNDKLSTMVCNDCIIRLDTWFSYKKQCHRNQAKLAEWLNKSTGQNALDVSVHIKSEPLDIDSYGNGPLPFKLEYPVHPDMMEMEFNEFDDDDMRPAFPQHPHNSERVYLEDLQRAGADESEATSLKCPECGKAFGSVQNRRRHQNMQHRKDKRAQMMEIRKPLPEPPAEPQPDNNLEQSVDNASVETSDQPPDNAADENSKQAIDNPTDYTEENLEETTNGTAELDPEQLTVSNCEQNTDNNGVEDAGFTAENMNNSEMDVETNTTLETSKEGLSEIPTDTETTSDNTPQEEVSIKEIDEKQPDTMEDAKDSEDREEIKENSAETTETSSEDPVVERPSNENQSQENEKLVEINYNDQQKIEFAAGLKLVQKDSTHIEFEPLSKTELSYIEKCKAMVSMFHSLQCACHNVQHKSLRHLLSHLREIRVWFPLFTCYSCMISFTDRSTFTRHHCRCPKSQLETLIKLSNLRKRSEIKTRLYQNYRCNRCKFLYSFHEDFCKHINEDHDPGAPPIYCSCRTVFDSVDEYKSHCYTSCVLSYYCDICFITTVTIDEFVKHCNEVHDTSEGFVLLQADSYTPRASYSYRQKEVDEDHVVEGKRERRKSAKEPIMVHVYEKDIQPELKDIPTRIVRQLVKLDFTPSTAREWNKSPTKCPLCQKEYSNVNNMVRHYRTHIEKQEVEIPYPLEDGEGENEDLYSCPECGGMYPASKWKKHIEDKHQPVSCMECDKVFQFQSELEQHRSVHLNLKVYRDSKTHSYKTAVISPGAETNGIVGGIMVMCEICDSMFKSKEELKHHKLTEHDLSSMSRASSSMENFDIKEEKSHIKDDEDAMESKTADYSLEGKLPCEYCSNLYASAKSLRDHVMNKHGADFIKKSEYPKKCEYCDKVCTTGAGLALHTQVHERCNPDKRSEFPKKCEYCDKICTTGAGLYLHTQMHERMTLGDVKKEKTASVKTGAIKSEVIKEIKKQESKEEEESYHTCKRCFKVFGTKGKLKDHMKSHGIHSSKPGPKPGMKKSRKIHCDLCHIAVENNDALAKHKADEHGDELDGMPTLKNEMELMDEDKASVVYTCDVCVETFESKVELQEHKEIHDKPSIVAKTKNTLIYCKYCKIAFSSINELTKHMHVEHGESAKPKITKDKSGENGDKPFKCSICSKGFATHGAMTAHFGWHKRSGSSLEVSEQSENTPHGTAAVKIAKKAKLLKKVAQAAINKQEPIEPPEFQCTTCFMELPNETALQIHVLEKHQGLDSLMLIPRCDTCNQDFVTQEEYETHKRFHDFLIRQKKHENQLKSQELIQTPIIQSVQSVADSPHSSPKRHPCSWCSSVFSRSDTLNTHIKQNHKEHVKTEFGCTQCDRVFEKQNSLTIHLKVHEKQKNIAAVSTVVVGGGGGVGAGGKVYSCSICNHGFSYPKDLRMHTINAHPF